MSLASVLEALMSERSPVALGTPAGPLAGEIRAVGEDVLTVRTETPPRRLVHLPMVSLVYCELR